MNSEALALMSLLRFFPEGDDLRIDKTQCSLIQRASRFSKKLFRHESEVSQHAIDRFLDGKRIHPATRKKLAETVDRLERTNE